ncbi:hypothetical protein HOLleu_42783 [Holothuria leucospilota]|uniref:Uncharacterized protein n=1 Tax=Holothuria leucospilota TaxID=206669 RepID=A0A9Q0YAA5_HOLLE|nr:hypothetical protein HOLleu_42783 [Holothuria leucospilota]
MQLVRDLSSYSRSSVRRQSCCCPEIVTSKRGISQSKTYHPAVEDLNADRDGFGLRLLPVKGEGDDNGDDDDDDDDDHDDDETKGNISLDGEECNTLSEDKEETCNVADDREDSIASFEEKNISDYTGEDNQESSGRRKKRNYNRRTPWKPQEKTCVIKYFQDAINTGSNPSRTMCEMALQQNPVLKGRTWSKIKDFVVAERKRKLKRLQKKTDRQLIVL